MAEASDDPHEGGSQSHPNILSLIEAQKEFSDEYLALLLRIFQKFPDCTWSAAENMIFEGLGVSLDHINCNAYRKQLNGHFHPLENGIPPDTGEKMKNDMASHVDQLRIDNCMRHRDAVRAIRLQMLVNHISQQTPECSSQIEILRSLTDKVTHLHEVTPPPVPVASPNISENLSVPISKDVAMNPSDIVVASAKISEKAIAMPQSVPNMVPSEARKDMKDISKISIPKETVTSEVTSPSQKKETPNETVPTVEVSNDKTLLAQRKKIVSESHRMKKEKTRSKSSEKPFAFHKVQWNVAPVANLSAYYARQSKPRNQRKVGRRLKNSHKSKMDKDRKAKTKKGTHTYSHASNAELMNRKRKYLDMDFELVDFEGRAQEEDYPGFPHPHTRPTKRKRLNAHKSSLAEIALPIGGATNASQNALDERMD